MIVGFGFTKLSAEKIQSVKGKIDINNNVSIKSVEEADLSLGKEKKNVAKFKFESVSKYEPAMGQIMFEGEILYHEDPKKVKDIISGWKKDKTLPKELMTVLLNTILSKCNIQALILSQEVNLPSPIPLPKVQISPEQKDKNYIG